MKANDITDLGFYWYYGPEMGEPIEWTIVQVYSSGSLRVWWLGDDRDTLLTESVGEFEGPFTHDG